MKSAFLAATLLLVLTATGASAAGLEKLHIYPFAQYFTWQEFNDTGSRILKESGYLYGVGAAAHLDLYAKSLVMRAGGELFGGQVNYDGATTDVNPALSGLPVKTDVNYFGTRIESDLGWRFELDNGLFTPFAGLGYRFWLRDLQDSNTVDRSGTPLAVSGITEQWQSLYARLGLSCEWPVSPDLTLTLSGGGKYPFYNRNTVDFAGVGDRTVEPGGRLSWFAELSGQYRMIRPSIYYEGFRYSRSSDVFAYHDTSLGRGVYIHQPKSESDTFGIRISIMLR